MKKLLSLLLSLVLIFTLTACTWDSGVPSEPTNSTTSATESTTTTSTTASTTAPTTEKTEYPVPPETLPDDTRIPTDSFTTTSTSTTTGNTVVSVDVSTTTTTAAPSTTEPTTTSATTATTTTAADTDKQLVDSLFALGKGQSRDGITLTGTITYVKEVSEQYGNATFEMQVQGTNGARTLLCYRVKPADASRLQVQTGQTITLTGTVQNYKGTIEFYPATYQAEGDPIVTTTTTLPAVDGAIDPNGIYDSAAEVALYIHTYGRLPQNFITKSQYKSQGRPRDKCCGGDRFYNNEGRLPSGYTYYECDIDTLGTTSRGAKRLVWTTSGIVYYTADHYGTFTQLYGER